MSEARRQSPLPGDPLIEQLRAARPEDPCAAEAQRAAVRVLARLAVQDATLHADEPTVGHGRAARRRRVVAGAAAACLLLGLVLWPSSVSNTRGSAERRPAHVETAQAPAPAPTAEAEPTVAVLARQAVGGNALARARLRDAGRAGRRALLSLAAQGAAPDDKGAGAGAERRRALEVLRSFGGLRSRGEVDAVAALAQDSALRTDAIALLASDVGRAGARHLGNLLAENVDAGSDVVVALKRVAALGRRQAAFAALVAGARAGSEEAAAAAMHVGGASGLKAVLDVVPAEVVGSERLAVALRDGPRTMRGRALRLAERGDRKAIRMAAAAQLPQIVPVLDARARDPDAGVATEAVELLAGIDAPQALVALGRALEGPSRPRVQEILSAAQPGAVDALARAARGSARGSAAALAALAVMGESGVQRLGDLAQSVVLARGVIAALATSPHASASKALAEVAARPAFRFEVVTALATRLKAGDEGAGSSLLALARGPAARAVLRALAGCGEAGVRWLREAERIPVLQRRARDLLNEMGAGSQRSAARGQPLGFAARSTKAKARGAV